MGHLLLGWIYLLKRKHEKAIIECERAVELNPNGADAHAHLALMYIHSDETELAIKLLKRAFRLNPIPPTIYYDFLAMAHMNNGNYEKAISLYKDIIAKYPFHIIAWYSMMECYENLDNEEKTNEISDKIKEIIKKDNLASDMFKKYSDLMPKIMCNG